jgi:hypothetical protein
MPVKVLDRGCRPEQEIRSMHPSHPTLVRVQPIALAIVLGTMGLLTMAGPTAAVESFLATELSGSAEVDGGGNPDQGDPDGSGTAYVTIDSAAAELCYGIGVANIQAATAAHIHIGDAGVNGVVVVPLDPPDVTTGAVEDCVTVEATVLEAIAANPAGHYVNVHNDEFPAGALRGQLEAAPEASPCTLVGTVVGGESGDSLTLDLDGQVIVLGQFMPNAEVEFTFYHGEEVSFTHTWTTNDEGIVEFYFGFQPGDEGDWTFTAVVLDAASCWASIEVAVTAAPAQPTPSTPAQPPASPAPVLPDTAVDGAVSAPVQAMASVLLALGILLGSASLVLSRRRI